MSGGKAPFVLVTVEGGIGAGKSTLLKSIKDLCRDDIVVLQEPVDRWCAPVTSTGESMLESYYADRKGVALAFQMFAMLTRVQQLHELLHHHDDKVAIVISERGSWSDYEIFGRPMHESGLLSEVDWHVYSAWFESVTRGALSPPVKPSGVAYLRTNPAVCRGRISKRGRHGEEDIDLDYLGLLHDAHETYVSNFEKNGGNVLEIDATVDLDEAGSRELALKIVAWAEGLAVGSR